MISHCIFDMDGLLLDTERIYTEVTQTIVARYGKTYQWDLKSRMMGQRQHEAAQLLVTELQLPITAEEYLLERNQMQDLLFPQCDLMPGVERLIKHLKRHKIPIAVATSSFKQAFELKTSRHRALFALFDAIVLGDDPNVHKGKPHPDIFEEAARRLNAPETRSCLVFEDAPSGVQAGLSAGMPVCWVPDENVDQSKFLKTLETNEQCKKLVIIDSLLNWDPSLYGLPAFAD